MKQTLSSSKALPFLEPLFKGLKSTSSKGKAKPDPLIAIEPIKPKSSKKVSNLKHKAKF